MMPNKTKPVIENKQSVIDNTKPSCYPEGDYGRYPFILYGKKDRERRLYDSLTYDFYSVPPKGKCA